MQPVTKEMREDLGVLILMSGNIGGLGGRVDFGCYTEAQEGGRQYIRGLFYEVQDVSGSDLARIPKKAIVDDWTYF